MNQPSLAAIADAAATLQWEGEPVSVRLCGEHAWAIAWIETDAHGGAVIPSRRRMHLSGVIVTGTARTQPVQRASVFAGYCRRAVFVPDGPGLLGIQVDAAVLGQGVIVQTPAGIQKVADADPLVELSTRVARNARRDFHDQVCAALAARN